MPLVYRTMKPDDDRFPIIESSARGLGVRSGTDIDVDTPGNVVVNGKGMSVAPAWRVLPIWRIPKRLRDKAPGACGANNTACFRAGAGAFQRGPFADGLELVPDTSIHGCLAPTQAVPFAEYERGLIATRAGWHVDES